MLMHGIDMRESVAYALKLFTQIFLHIFDHRADFLDRCFQLIGCYPQFIAPVIHFMRLSHINSRIIWLTCLCYIVWHTGLILRIYIHVKTHWDKFVGNARSVSWLCRHPRSSVPSCVLTIIS